MNYILKLKILFCFLILFFSSRGFSQTSISGIINQYSVIDSIYPSGDTLLVASPLLFTTGDTVLVYQAKGGEVYTDESNPEFWAQLGDVRSSVFLNDAGKYEILLIKEITGSEIILKAPLNNTYNPKAIVQLVKVASYRNAEVTSELTCQAWNGSTGGILAIIVSDTLTLSANINVEGKGFRGGVGVLGNGDCAETDSVLFQKYFYPDAFTEAGYKGEGIALHPTDTTLKGLGKWTNGGGGGNSRFAGGGGGSNFRAGGNGGYEDISTCKRLNYEGYLGSPWDLNGRGGQDLSFFINSKVLFFGGGGGSGNKTTSLTASTGGNGGGIVIIMAKFIKANNYNIIANGASVSSVSTAGAGGGGGGGAIVFDVDTVKGNLGLFVEGGDGGNTIGAFISGPGGGGGGGIIFCKHNYVNYNSVSGKSGLIQDKLPVVDPHGSTDGIDGARSLFVNVPLTGFLFNSITNNQQICKDEIPGKLVGSNPRGGNGTFAYQWQKKNNSTSWSNIVGATDKDFQPLSLTDTTYYRRVVNSAGITDTSYSVTIDVHDFIVNNQVFGDDVITCIGNTADTITGTTVKLGGDNITYNYIWQYSNDSLNWFSKAGLNDTTYLHGTINDTTFVKRIVISGACIDTTQNPVKITALPQISDNTLSVNQEICYGQKPVEIIGSLPGNGDGSYSITWEKKTSGSWSIITDSTRYNLAPAELIETTYFRRIIESDDCIDISDSVKVNVLPLIENDNIITSTPAYTCYNTLPALINGSLPTGGNNTYSYQWQNSTDAVVWSNIAENATNEDFQSIALVSKTYFRRIVTSGLDDCCQSISDTLEIDIYDLPVASITSFSDTICSGADISLDFSFSSGKQPYTLTYSNGDNNFTTSPINNTVYSEDINPETNQQSKIYNYTISSLIDDNACEATDITGESIVTVYGLPQTNAGLNTESCKLSFQLQADKTLGVGLWSQVSGNGHAVLQDKTLHNTTVSVNNAGAYKYKWKEVNWLCEDSAYVEIGFYEKPFNINAGKDTSLFFIDEYTLSGIYENPDTIKPVETKWEFLSGTGMIANDEVLKTKITELIDADKTGILIKWTVSKGVCLDITDTVKINLREIFTPTGFTPNGDGINDYLTFTGLENAVENELIIYNRWGTEVFSTLNYSNDPGWDGKNQKNGADLPEGTYYYILKVIDKLGNTQVNKGFIVIKRF